MAGDEKNGKLDDVLAGARARIDEIDAGLLELLARRKQTVDEIAMLKKEHGLPVYHPAREEDLISKRRAEAGARSLDPMMVEGIFRTIMRGSRITQGESMTGHAVLPGAPVVLVGGKGGMGRVLDEWFSRAGYDVRVLDRDDWGRAEALCKGAKLVVLAVPIDVTGQTAARIAPYLSADCILADITSVKTAPLNAMLAAHPGPVVGLHPMFGPGTRSLDKQIVVVVGGRDEQQWSWVMEQLATWGAVIVRSGAEEHDRVMDVVQGLRHFATFAFGQFLHRTDVDLARTLEFSSPIYRLELGMVGRLFAQDPTLYAEIIFSTPERRELLCRYAESLSDNLQMLKEGDMELFLEEFARIAEWFGPFSDQAIRESGFLIEKMTERF